MKRGTKTSPRLRMTTFENTFRGLLCSSYRFSEPMSGMLEKSFSDELLLLLTLSRSPESPEVKDVLKIKMSKDISHLRKNHDIHVRSLQASTSHTPTLCHDESLTLELSRNSVEASPSFLLSIMSLCLHSHCLLCAYQSSRIE